MEEFNKFSHRGWKKKVPYQATDAEMEILSSDPSTLKERSLLRDTIADIGSKNTTDPSKEEMVWLELRYSTLMEKVNPDAFTFKLSCMEIAKEGDNFTGILNYFKDDGFEQLRF